MVEPCDPRRIGVRVRRLLRECGIRSFGSQDVGTLFGYHAGLDFRRGAGFLRNLDNLLHLGGSLRLWRRNIRTEGSMKKKAEQGARANAGTCHASCDRMCFRNETTEWES